MDWLCDVMFRPHVCLYSLDNVCCCFVCCFSFLSATVMMLKKKINSVSTYEFVSNLRDRMDAWMETLTCDSRSTQVSLMDSLQSGVTVHEWWCCTHLPFERTFIMLAISLQILLKHLPWKMSLIRVIGVSSTVCTMVNYCLICDDSKWPLEGYSES